MRKINLPNADGWFAGILVVEIGDYPITARAVEKAHKKLRTGINEWERGKRGGLRGRRKLLVDFWNGPAIFKNRKALMRAIRHHNSIWRSNLELIQKKLTKRAL